MQSSGNRSGCGCGCFLLALLYAAIGMFLERSCGIILPGLEEQLGRMRSERMQSSEKMQSEKKDANGWGGVEVEFQVPAVDEVPSAARKDLQPMIDRLRALKCKNADSALYQKRLLALLPLIRNGADVDVTLPETKGNTALHFACALGSWSISQWLVEHGANVNAKTHRGATPMDCLGKDNAARIRKLLKDHGGHYGL